MTEVLRVNGIADISCETVRQVLKAGGMSWQATKTWKASNEPGFQSLRARWPGHKLYLICDNSVHKRAEVRAWCTANAVELGSKVRHPDYLTNIA